MGTNDINISDVVMDCSVSIIINNGKPAVMARRISDDPRLMKVLILAAINNEEITIRPRFKDLVHGINQLLSKGIIIKKDDKYVFTF